MKKILVVDDRIEILEVIECMLKKQGFIVYTSSTGKKALYLCRNTEFDLVISDFVLQETTGVILLNKIRKEQPQVKTILMSGIFNPGKEEIEILGIDDFLKKPFGIEKLKSSIKKVLNNNSAF